MPQTDFHENFAREEVVAGGSDRSFGFVMTGACLFFAVLNGWHNGRLWLWLALVALAFLAASLIRPAILKPLNHLWFRFGLLLHKIVNPVVMGLLFYGTVVPTGIVMRLMGKDLLRLRLERESESYWIARQSAGPASETMKDQF